MDCETEEIASTSAHVDPKPHKAVSKFGQSIFLQNAGDISKQGDYVFSPVSAFICIYMAYLGAGNKTKEEMSRTLCLETSDDEEVIALIKTLGNSKNSFLTLRVANGMVVGENFDVQQAFVDRLKESFSVQIRNVKFGTAAGEKSINDWVAKQTEGKIRDLVKDSTSNVRLLLVNAIYLKGKWVRRFKKRRTSKGKFSTQANQSIKVDYMHQTDHFEYFHSPDHKFQLAFFPYKTEKNGLTWKMAILLPEKGQNPTNYLEFFEVDSLRSMRTRHEKLEVKLPKFKAETTTDLIPVLKKLGMKEAFSWQADFSAIGDSNKSENLRVSRIIQKCFVEVDEEGTKAAVVSSATNVRKSRRGKKFERPPIPFHVVSPFTYAIIEANSSTVLFLGVVSTFSKRETKLESPMFRLNNNEDNVRVEATSTDMENVYLVDRSEQTEGDSESDAKNANASVSGSN